MAPKNSESPFSYAKRLNPHQPDADPEGERTEDQHPVDREHRSHGVEIPGRAETNRDRVAPMRPRSLKPPLQSRPSWWLEEARTYRPNEIAPPLAGALEADVAVVGGGYTGLWTALALRERDPSLRVAVLEAREIGDGPSGRNGGFLHGYWSSLATLRAVLGDGAALQLAHASSRIVPAVRDFLDRRGEDTWLREGGLLKVAATAAEDDAVERSVRAARELGVDEEAVALGEAEARRRLDSPRVSRGVLFRDGATVQPARLVLALKRAAQESGVELFEHTPVTAVRPESARGARRNRPGGPRSCWR